MPPPPLPKRKRKETALKIRSPRKRIFLTLLATPCAIALTLFLTGAIRQFKIPTGAMKPTLPPGTHLLAEKCSLWFAPPKRGEVVVFTTLHIPSLMERSQSAQYYIKRLIALPGDTLFIEDGVLHVNDAPFLVNSPEGEPLIYSAQGNLKDGATFTVPEDCFFVLGDNSENSLDSRFWGPLPTRSVKYRYWFTYYFDKRVEEQRRERDQKQRERLNSRF